MSNLRIYIVLLFAGLFLFSGTQAQVVLPFCGSTTVHLQPGESVTVYDDGGMYGNYQNMCSSVLYLVSDSGTAIRVNGHIDLEPTNDRLKIWYDNATALPVFDLTGNRDFEATSGSGRMMLHFTSNNSVTADGFMFTATAFSMDASSISDIRVVDVTQTSARIVWNDTLESSTWAIRYGDSPARLMQFAVSQNKEITLTGLTPHQNYFFKIFNAISVSMTDTVERVMHFQTEGFGDPNYCIEYDDLYAEYVRCTYGTFYEPELYEGVVDNGSANPTSRHTVCHDTSATDARTGGLLSCIPPGFNTSVRLGNWNVNGQAETITYEYHVDTAVVSLLLLKYAVVLEQPTHSQRLQPKFTLDILDAFGSPINTDCYSANFIADSNLGWNVAQSYLGTSILWKDWTSLGIDLAPLQGQTIYIKLATFDCALELHFGYAYFILTCLQKSVESTNCGFSVANDFEAPEGFSYSWYNVNNPDVILSHQRTLHVNDLGQYNCELGFVGADSTVACTFDLMAIAGAQFPFARMNWRVEGEDDCDVWVRLLNESIVTLDADHTELTSMSISDAEWFFDGMPLADPSPVVLCSPGTHNVMLVASTGGGACTDTATAVINVPNPCNDTVFAVICEGESYRLFDTLLSETGTYEADSGRHHRLLHLTVRPPHVDTVYVNILETQLPFTFAGVTFEDTVSNWPFFFTDSYGCDSTVYFNLQIWPDVQLWIDSTVCESQMPVTICDTLLDRAGNYTLQYEGSHGEDSIIGIHLVVKSEADIYQYVTMCRGDVYRWIDGVEYYSPTSLPQVHLLTSEGCDSTVHLVLTFDNSLVTAMSINPEIVDYQCNEVTLSDISSGVCSRKWNYAGQTDTLREVHFVYPMDKDSVEVILEATSCHGCTDTAWGLVRIDRSALWAPNAFMPDEAQNNRFLIASTDVVEGEVSIYNRQGALVATFGLPGGWWDGTYRGKPCKQDAYVWIATYRTRVHPLVDHIAKGTILLMR